MRYQTYAEFEKGIHNDAFDFVVVFMNDWDTSEC